MSKVTHKVRACIKTTDIGTQKYVTVGRAITDDQGRISIIINTLPRDMSQWTGWLNLFPLDSDGESF